MSADGALTALPTTAVDAGPARARKGKLGLCMACQEPVAVHFDTTGEFIGCPEAEGDTVFVLVPANGRAIDPAMIGRSLTPPEPPPQRTRAFRVARYTPVDGTADKVNQLVLTDNRRLTLKALIAVHKANGGDGALAHEVTKRSGLTHGVVQEALRWLRDRALILAVEDAPGGSIRR